MDHWIEDPGGHIAPSRRQGPGGRETPQDRCYDKFLCRAKAVGAGPSPGTRRCPCQTAGGASGGSSSA